MKLKIRDDEYDLDPGKLKFGEAVAIERATGLTFSQFGQSLSSGSIVALQAFVWSLMRRTNPDLRFDDVDDLELGDVTFEGDPDDPDQAETAAAGTVDRVDPTPEVSATPEETS